MLDLEGISYQSVSSIDHHHNLGVDRYSDSGIDRHSDLGVDRRYRDRKCCTVSNVFVA